MIYQTVEFCDFQDAFYKMDRNHNFTYQGKKALYDYLYELSEDTLQGIELDVIAICCDFTEYHDDELYDTYGYLIDYGEFSDHEDHIQAIKDALIDHTLVIPVDDNYTIVQSF